MDALDFLRGKISDFPGYDDDVGRERSDELVRSYLGEALARAQDRIGTLDSDVRRRIGDLLFRVGFVNQAANKAYAETGREPAVLTAMGALDARTVALADRAATIESAGFAQFVDQAEQILDERDATMTGASISCT